MRSYIEPDMFGHQEVREWPFGNLEPRAYSLIVADPPWTFVCRSKLGEGKSPQAHYRTMSLEEIASLPVADLAREDCLIWLWCTAPMLNRQIEIMEGWGFAFKSSGVWVKTTTTGKIAFGTGYLLRNAHECFVLGTRGNPETMSKSVRSALLAPVREHSRKPDESYAMAKSLVPYGRAAELFARESRDGFETWGNEKNKFDATEAAE